MSRTSGIAFEVGFVRPLADHDLALTVPSGVAAEDYDGDGRVDLVIVRGDTGPNLLYRNLGDLRFEEVGEDAGIAWSSAPGENLRHGSPGLADLDGDGDLDLLLPGLGYDAARLYRNDGDAPVAFFQEPARRRPDPSSASRRPAHHRAGPRSHLVTLWTSRTRETL